MITPITHLFHSALYLISLHVQLSKSKAVSVFIIVKKDLINADNVTIMIVIEFNPIWSS